MYCIQCCKLKGRAVVQRFPEEGTYVHPLAQETFARDCRSRWAFHIQQRKDMVTAVTYCHAAANLDSGFPTVQITPNREGRLGQRGLQEHGKYIFFAQGAGDTGYRNTGCGGPTASLKSLRYVLWMLLFVSVYTHIALIFPVHVLPVLSSTILLSLIAHGCVVQKP